MIISGLTLMRSVSLHRVRACLLLMVSVYLNQPQPVLAQSISNRAVHLISPEAVHDVLEQYFKLPDALLTTENERAIFIRRAQREIPELLATEGFFSSKLYILNLV